MGPRGLTRRVAGLTVPVALTLGGCTGAPGPAVAESTASPAPAGEVGRVTRVVDGDTLVVDGVRVRLIGIDTPESKQPGSPVECFALEAAARMGALLPEGTAVRLALDVDPTDDFGRTLAYVYRVADDLFVNAALVREGYASVLTVPPNVRHADDFLELQGEARQAGRGLWSSCP